MRVEGGDGRVHAPPINCGQPDAACGWRGRPARRRPTHLELVAKAEREVGMDADVADARAEVTLSGVL